MAFMLGQVHSKLSHGSPTACVHSRGEQSRSRVAVPPLQLRTSLHVVNLPGEVPSVRKESSQLVSQPSQPSWHQPCCQGLARCSL